MNPVAIVTASDSGIGQESAKALAESGFDIGITYHEDEAGARETLDAVEATGRRGEVRHLDLTVLPDAADVIDELAGSLGGLDVLVNNAGVMLLGTIVGAGTEDWRRMINTNVLGVMYMTHAAIEGMVEQGSGDIVNMSSVAGRVARRGSGVYNASKWAVNAFSESLRQEVTGLGVRVSLVEPGAVTTELTDHITQPEAKAAAETMYTSMRALQADDIARAVVYVVTQPQHVAINEVLIRPTDQER
jgi:NADP-dependent 3-hydroxy acid dehydrogenase YdfG